MSQKGSKTDLKERPSPVKKATETKIVKSGERLSQKDALEKKLSTYYSAQGMAKTVSGVISTEEEEVVKKKMSHFKKQIAKSSSNLYVAEDKQLTSPSDADPVKNAKQGRAGSRSSQKRDSKRGANQTKDKKNSETYSDRKSIEKRHSKRRSDIDKPKNASIAKRDSKDQTEEIESDVPTISKKLQDKDTSRTKQVEGMEKSDSKTDQNKDMKYTPSKQKQLEKNDSIDESEMVATRKSYEEPDSASRNVRGSYSYSLSSRKLSDDTSGTTSSAPSSDHKIAKPHRFSTTSSLSQSISELNFRISDTDLTQLLNKSQIKHVRKVMHAKPDYMCSAEFDIVVNKLYKCCLKSITDLHELHVRRTIALPLIKDIITRADPEYISIPHIIHMVWSVMSCLHHFQLRLKHGSNKLIMYTRQKTLDKCMEYYLLLIKMFNKKIHRVILSAIITFYKDGKLWEIDYACTNLIVSLLKIYTDVEEGINDLIDTAVYSITISVIEAQKVMQVIYEVLKHIDWRTVSDILVDRLISMLECGISPRNIDEQVYVPLKLGVELSLKHLIAHATNEDVMVILKKMLIVMVSEYVTDDMLICLGTLSSYAASKYLMTTLYNNFTFDIINNISQLTHKKNPLCFIVATKIWMNLMDRNDNVSKIKQPRIFFHNCNYHIKLRNKCNLQDKKFFKAHRSSIYYTAVDCFKDSNNKNEVNAAFSMCAVTLIEIPCGYTAAIFTSVAISIQVYAFKISLQNTIKSHYLHAAALSLLSLICYIHKAEIFYGYVVDIIDRRSEWAPQLMPPLKARYEYALHHILWNKPDLFFEEWEARFGLWKCFRIRKKKVHETTPQNGSNDKNHNNKAKK